MGHIEWAELGLFAMLSIVLTLIAVRLLLPFRPKPSTRHARPMTSNAGLDVPEVRLLTLALPLHLLWEIAQFPLYTVWHQNDWSYMLYGLAHCTLGDLVVVLILYELIALIRYDRRWFLHTVFTSGILFTVGGITYTVLSEINHVRIKGTWGYTEQMPIVPLVNIGGTPFLQWLLIPPVLLWMMRLVSRQRGAQAPA